MQDIEPFISKRPEHAFAHDSQTPTKGKPPRSELKGEGQPTTGKRERKAKGHSTSKKAGSAANGGSSKTVSGDGGKLGGGGSAGAKKPSKVS